MKKGDVEGCLYSLDWTTGLTFELTFELFFNDQYCCSFAS